MSNLVRPNVTLACTPAGGAPIQGYLWYLACSAADSAIQRAAVAAQLAAGGTPTGYAGASEAAQLQVGNCPGLVGCGRLIWAFAVAVSTTWDFVLASDTINKTCGDGC